MIEHTERQTMADNVFAVPVFLVVFRETLETVIIVSVLLAFLKQTLDGPNRDVAVYKTLVKQVRAHSGHQPPPLKLNLYSSAINGYN